MGLFRGHLHNPYLVESSYLQSMIRNIPYFIMKKRGNARALEEDRNGCTKYIINTGARPSDKKDIAERQGLVAISPSGHVAQVPMTMDKYRPSRS